MEFVSCNRLWHVVAVVSLLQNFRCRQRKWCGRAVQTPDKSAFRFAEASPASPRASIAEPQDRARRQLCRADRQHPQSRASALDEQSLEKQEKQEKACPAGCSDGGGSQPRPVLSSCACLPRSPGPARCRPTWLGYAPVASFLRKPPRVLYLPKRRGEAYIRNKTLSVLRPNASKSTLEPNGLNQRQPPRPSHVSALPGGRIEHLYGAIL